MCPVLCEQEGEDAAQFANRVKSAIAHQGGLLDLPWWGFPNLMFTLLAFKNATTADSVGH